MDDAVLPPPTSNLSSPSEQRHRAVKLRAADPRHRIAMKRTQHDMLRLRLGGHDAADPSARQNTREPYVAIGKSRAERQPLRTRSRRDVVQSRSRRIRIENRMRELAEYAVIVTPDLQPVRTGRVFEIADVNGLRHCGRKRRQDRGIVLPRPNVTGRCWNAGQRLTCRDQSSQQQKHTES